MNSNARSPEGGRHRKQAVIDKKPKRLLEEKDITKLEHATYIELYQASPKQQFYVN